MRLYHAGFQEIRRPDIRHGRKNADFGQGFYLSPDQAFSERWAKERRGEETVINTYELRTEGLRVKRFQRDGEWFDYIYANRHGRPDTLEFDLIIGPIANDTLFDTLGIMTSGVLPREQAGRLLRIGPVYEQVVLKTERAAEQLAWLSARVLGPEELARNAETLKREEAAYQELFAREMEKIAGGE